MPTPFEYAPAPESRSVVDLASSYGLFIDGEFVDGTGGSLKSINPATEEVLAEVAEASAADVDRAVKAARRAYTKVWSKTSGAERAKYLFRIARLVQERSRELAVLETLDNGKPIKESRDVDIPLVAAHFFYYAGWADKLEHAGFGPNPRPLGVAAQVIPWNFPLLMLAWKVAPALAAGNTVVLKPAETTPLTALLFADICRQADLPPGVVNIVTGAGETGRRSSSTPASTRSRSPARPRWARRSRARSPAPTSGSPSSSAARPPTSSSTTRRSTRRSRASSTASSSTRATSAAPAPGCSCRRTSPRSWCRDSSAASPRCASATRSTRTPTSARSTPSSSSSASATSRASATTRAPSAGPPTATSRARATGSPPPSSRASRRRTASRARRSSGRCCRCSPSARRGGGREGEQHARTACRRASGPRRARGSSRSPSQMRAGVVWANTFNRFDPTSPFGGYKESGYGREGGRHGLAAYLDVV